MSKPIFLHIGMPKTGTSSIQAYLHSNRRGLRKRRVIVPRAPGGKNHSAVTLYALGDTSRETVRRAHGLTNLPSVLAFRASLRQKLEEEAAEWQQDESVVFTNEHMSLLREPEEFERLRQLLAVAGERPLQVVVYLRRQDLYYLSGYSQRIKNGAVLHWSEAEEKFDPADYDYSTVLKAWTNAFGKENVIVRVFERGQMVGGDLIRDFLSVIQCDDFSAPEVMRKNESLDARSLEFLRRLNRWYPRFIDGRLSPHRRALVSAMEQISAGSSLRMGRGDAFAFLKQYEDSNKAVAQEYLGRTDGRLFYDIPKDEPEKPPSLSVDDVIEITAKLWAHAHKIDLNEVPKAPAAEETSIQARRPARESRKLARRSGAKDEGSHGWNWF